MTRDSKPWTTAEIAAVKAMTEAGLSAREIAARLRGRTRAAVIGYWHRANAAGVWIVGHGGEAVAVHARKDIAIKRATDLLNQDHPKPPWYPQEVACMCRRIPVAELSKWVVE